MDSKVVDGLISVIGDESKWRPIKDYLKAREKDYISGIKHANDEVIIYRLQGKLQELDLLVNIRDSLLSERKNNATTI